MSHTPRILAFAGSTRRESFNRKLLKLAVQGAQQAGAQVTVVELADYPFPLFNEDDEAAGQKPTKVTELKQLFVEHDGILIASPEYNSSITPLLKNTLDWVSRAAPGEPGLIAFQGKVAQLVSASPGALGGLRGLVHLRAILGNIGVIVLPAQIAVPKAHDEFQADGTLKNAKLQASVADLGAKLAGFITKLKA